MTPRKCLFCRKPLPETGPTDFHTTCSQKFFGSPQPPVLPYSLDSLHELAEQIVQRSIAVAGVQPKLSLGFERATKNGPSRLTLVGTMGHFILKPPHAHYPELVENEHLTMQLATHFGLPTVPFSFVRLASGELAYITRRIDRLPNGAKLPMEDFCQLTERLTEYKYRASMEQVGKAVRRYSSVPGLDAVRLFEQALFVFLTGNADMHLKNFSLLTAVDGTIALAPAYDMVATKLAMPDDPEELALTLNGKKNRLRLADFLAFAETLQLPAKTVSNTLAHFRKKLPGVHTLLEQSELSREARNALEALISERADRLNLTNEN